MVCCGCLCFGVDFVVGYLHHLLLKVQTFSFYQIDRMMSCLPQQLEAFCGASKSVILPPCLESGLTGNAPSFLSSSLGRHVGPLQFLL